MPSDGCSLGAWDTLVLGGLVLVGGAAVVDSSSSGSSDSSACCSSSVGFAVDGFFGRRLGLLHEDGPPARLVLPVAVGTDHLRAARRGADLGHRRPRAEGALADDPAHNRLRVGDRGQGRCREATGAAGRPAGCRDVTRLRVRSRRGGRGGCRRADRVGRRPPLRVRHPGHRHRAPSEAQSNQDRRAQHAYQRGPTHGAPLPTHVSPSTTRADALRKNVPSAPMSSWPEPSRHRHERY